MLKSRDITVPAKNHLVKAMVFPVVMYGCENWTIKKAECQKLMLLNCGFGEDSTHGHHQMVNTEIRLIIFFAAEEEEALYSQQKEDQEMTVAQIMNSLLPNSDSN